MRETEIEGDASRFFLGQSVWVGASERLDQRALAMVNMPGRGDDEMFHDALSFNFETTKDTKSTKNYRTKRLMPFCGFVTLN